jgi:hypothetical protein
MSNSVAVSVTQASVDLAVAVSQSNEVAVTATHDVDLAVAAVQPSVDTAVTSTQAVQEVAVSKTHSNDLAVSVTDTVAVAVTSSGPELIVHSLRNRFLTNDPFDADRFTDYANGVFNEGCWAHGLDMTGFSLESDNSDRGDARRGTLIGRNCALTANHFGPRVGNQIIFTDGNGDKFTYTVAAESSGLGGSDIRVFTLNESVSPTLPSYAIATADEIAAGDFILASRSRREFDAGAFNSPAAQRAMIEQVSNVGATSIEITQFPPAEIQVNRTSANVGDSSDPWFIMDEGGVLKAVSSYWGVSIGPFWGGYLTEIDAWLATQGTSRLAQQAVL